MSSNSFDTRSTVCSTGKNHVFYDLTKIKATKTLPFSIKILLENLLRNEDGTTVNKESIEQLIHWQATAEPSQEIAYRPARVLMQDFTGVPGLVDLATMRDAIQGLNGDPAKIRPLQPTDLVIDHSVQVDHFGSGSALSGNTAIEFDRNKERYEFLKWGQTSFANFRVIPPGVGIVHQVNIEYLAQVAFSAQHNDEHLLYPDTVVGTDSHTTMVNGLGVLGWGVGGIEAEAVMLGQPISMLVPKVIGFRIDGRLPIGTTATDMVLVIVEIIRKHGAVGKFVEFYGPGIPSLSVADRATIANMAPEYGATCGIFPVDEQTLNYLRLTGRSEEQIALVETMYRAMDMFGSDSQAIYSEQLELDLSSVEPCLAGPKRPQDRVRLVDLKKVFQQSLQEAENRSPASVDATVNGQDIELSDGSVVIAAITSCTNTSNPSVMLGAGLIARNAVAKGLKVKPWVKTSLAPGSRVVSQYLNDSGLLQSLEKMHFNVVGYGCTTCIGNSGPLPTEVSKAVSDGHLNVASVLSGNRNFEGRVHAEVKMNFLASPPLVVAYAIAGTVNIDLSVEPLGYGADGEPVFLNDIWPDQKELDQLLANLKREQFTSSYDNIFDGDDNWQSIEVEKSSSYQWNAASTYVRKPNFFDGIDQPTRTVSSINNARVLALLGDSVTTDHISPAGSIKADSPAGKYLQEQGIAVHEFNSYGSRRGNHEVMMRGTFANIRLRNKIAPGTEGGVTLHLPSGQPMSIYDAAMQYSKESVPAIVIAGKAYGTGSSRDWAAKGPQLQGVQAVIAEDFERIHRTNLVGVGILPLQFQPGETVETLALTGHESYTIEGIDDGRSKEVTVIATADDGASTRFTARVRIDTPTEIEYYQNGGILRHVLKQLAA